MVEVGLVEVGLVVVKVFFEAAEGIFLVGGIGLFGMADIGFFLAEVGNFSRVIGTVFFLAEVVVFSWVCEIVFFFLDVVAFLGLGVMGYFPMGIFDLDGGVVKSYFLTLVGVEVAAFLTGYGFVVERVGAFFLTGPLGCFGVAKDSIFFLEMVAFFGVSLAY